MKIRIATTEDASRYHHYASVVESPEFEWLGTIKQPFDEKCLADVDALIVSCDQFVISRTAILACRNHGIPTFHVLDGVVDWRTTFENPEFDLSLGGLPLFRPLIADVVFTMGTIQAEVLRWLGNTQISASGLPRFDGWNPLPCRIGRFDAAPRLLVASANTPWATEVQRTVVEEQFSNLVRALADAEREGAIAQTVYRVSDKLACELNIVNCRNILADQALSDADIVVTTPSTFAIEAMLRGVPTAILDPFGLPVLTPSAWPATNWETVIQSLPSLTSPESERASFQDHIVSSLVRSDGVAASRIVKLICGIVKQGVNHFASDASVVSESSSLPTAMVGAKEVPPGAVMATLRQLDQRCSSLAENLKALQEAQARPDFRYVATTLKRFLVSRCLRANK